MMAPDGAPEDINVSPIATLETISIAPLELSRVDDREVNYFISAPDIFF